MFTVRYRLKENYGDQVYYISDFSDRKMAELALANLAKNPDFRGGEIKEIDD